MKGRFEWYLYRAKQKWRSHRAKQKWRKYNSGTQGRKYINPEKFVDLQVQQRIVNLTQFAGFVLLGYAAINFFSTIFPLDPLAANWQAQTISQMVDQAWFILIGLVLIFSIRDKKPLAFWIVGVLDFLSSFAIVLAILYFLMFPLLIFDTYRVAKLLKINFYTQAVKNQTYAEHFKQQIDQAKSPQELLDIAKTINPQAPPPRAANFPGLKRAVLEELNDFIRGISENNGRELQSRLGDIYKNSARYAIGTLIAGFSFFKIWKTTDWARILLKRLSS